MANEKHHSHPIEDIAATDQIRHGAIPATYSDIYHGDAEIVVEIGSKAITSNGDSDLKLAKDGHVCLSNLNSSHANH